ncbi:DUF1850 domain-containing protein [Halosolutus gelatinilyticus]|uniref:DUF1850 domain-containing protein n=1 Tax=Halosolutus gelatinilyticus TaxID=2931975 RepID=UPI001FF26E2C|nr:DUF1850 domain-containing protein [Halosolutus gelatinilyticus]
MSRLSRRQIAVVVLALLVATAAAAVATASANRTLVVADAETGDRVLERPVEDGTEVTLSYTHSVEKTPIEDVYVVDGTTLRMDRMVFRSHGAGLPTDAAYERTDEGFVLPLNDSYETVRVVPGSIAGHELVVGDNRYDLVAHSDGSVVIFVTERTLSDRLSDPLSLGDRSEPIPATDLQITRY